MPEKSKNAFTGDPSVRPILSGRRRDDPPAARLFKKQRDAVAQELKDLQEVYENLTFRCWFFTEAEKAGTVQIKKNLDALDIPEDMRPLVKKYGKSLALDHAAETGDGD